VFKYSIDASFSDEICMYSYNYKSKFGEIGNINLSYNQFTILLSRLTACSFMYSYTEQGAAHFKGYAGTMHILLIDSIKK